MGRFLSSPCPHPRTCFYLHHALCWEKKVSPGTWGVRGGQAPASKSLHLCAASIIVLPFNKPGPEVGRSLKRSSAPSSVLWHSPDPFSHSPRSRESAAACWALFHSGNQNFLCLPTAASVKNHSRGRPGSQQESTSLFHRMNERNQGLRCSLGLTGQDGRHAQE